MKKYLFAIGLIYSQFALCQTDRVYDLVPIYESRNDSVTDTLYTTYLNDNSAAQQQYGSTSIPELSIAGYIPCAPDTLPIPGIDPAINLTGVTPYQGAVINGMNYTDNQVSGYGNNQHGYTHVALGFACAQPNNYGPTAPLYRMYKGSPQTDHVYVSTADDFNAYKQKGYGFDRIEGYIFTSPYVNPYEQYPLGAASAFYRVGITHANGDVEHRHTMNQSVVQSLVSKGWTNEGIVGYVFPQDINKYVDAANFTGTLNGTLINPNSTAPVLIQDVTPPAGSFTFGGNTQATPPISYGQFFSNTTNRPTNTTTQHTSFDLSTGSIFNTSGLSHLIFFLRYSSPTSKNSISTGAGYYGVGLIIASPGFLGCPTTPGGGGQLYFESLPRTPNTSPSCSTTAPIIDNPRLTTPLVSNTTYTIDFAVTDAAVVTVKVTNKATNQPLTFAAGGTQFSESFAAYYACPITGYGYGQYPVSNTFCGDPLSPGAFPPGTGYILIPDFSQTNTTATISNIVVNWQ